MRTLNLFIITAFILSLTSCKKENKTLETDYNFPFTAEVGLEGNLLQNKEYALTLKLANEGPLPNTNNNYTLSFTGDNIKLSDQTDKPITQGNEYKFTFDNPPIIKFISEKLGTQRFTINIKNTNGYTISKTVSFNTVKSSMNVTTSERIFNTFVNTNISLKFTVSQEIQSPLKLNFANVSNLVSLALNGQTVAREATIDLQPNTQYELLLSFSGVGTYNPKIVFSDGNSDYPVELSVSVAPRELKFSNLNLKYKRGIDDVVYHAVTNLLEYDESFVYNMNAEIETVSPKLKVLFKTNKSIIKEMHYNGKIYLYGDEILLNNPNDFSKINIFFKDDEYGAIEFQVAVIDDFGTQSNYLTTLFRYYKAPTISGSLTGEKYDSHTVSLALTKKDIKSNTITIESKGNPIKSITAQVNTSISLYKASIFDDKTFDVVDNNNINVNAEFFNYQFTLSNSNMITNYDNAYYQIVRFPLVFKRSAFTVNRTYGSPVVLYTN